MRTVFLLIPLRNHWMISSLILFFAISSYAQKAPGSLEGYTLNKDTGDTLRFVSLVLTPATGKAFTGMSDQRGYFLLENLPEGTFSLEARLSGFDEVKEKNLLITSGSRLHFNVQMKAQKVEDIKLVDEEKEKNNYDSYGRANKAYGGAINSTIAYSPDYGQNTESYSGINENGFKNVQVNPLSTFSVDVDAASYSNVRRYITAGNKPPVDAVRVEEFINYFDYDYPDPTDGHPFSITAEAGDCPWNSGHKLVHIGLQAERIKTKNLPPNNLVFLLDVSGSMSAENKLPLLKKSFRLLVDELRKEDHVAIVVYAGAAGVVLEPTSADNKTRILGALDSLQAGGSTAGGQGIQLAYKVAEQNFVKGGNNRVILATDGDFNVGMSSDGEMQRLIEEKRNTGIFLTCLGFGMGNYKDSKLEVLADKGNGNYAYIDNLLEAKKVLVTEMGGTLLTLAKDVKIQVEFNPMIVESYRLVGYENRLLNEEDFNDDKKDAGEIGAGHSVTALYEIVLKGSGEEGPSVDPLRYQQVKPAESALGNEMLTVKFRYKKPDGDTSILLERNLQNASLGWGDLSEDFRFASAVAAYGMLLRNSDYRGTATYDEVLEWASKSKGSDKNGYRAEFIRLVELTKSL